MRILMAGSRYFDKMSFEDLVIYVCSKLDLEIQKHKEPIILMSGGAKGVDIIAEEYAKYNNLPFELYKADWDSFGKSAGYKRNVDMGMVCDVGVIFHNGISKGTHHMIDVLKKLNKPYKIYYPYENQPTQHTIKPF